MLPCGGCWRYSGWVFSRRLEAGPLGNRLELAVGVKADPVEHRYSYAWLFELMRSHGVFELQLGTFFELYSLPDDYFVSLREQAAGFGVRIGSVFTSHRELGGFFRGEPGWESVARRNWVRLIEVGGLLGACSVGSSPGSVLRDQPETKDRGLSCYLLHMKELMSYGKECGLERLTIEPMSCLAEPPTLPEEIRAVAEELLGYHETHAETVPVGYCCDVAHGYADAEGRVRHGNMELLEACLPYLAELHLKNTDARFEETFGFGESERGVGIVDVAAVRDLLEANAERVPLNRIVGYLEIGGPKTGRDYSDGLLEGALSESLEYLVRVFRSTGAADGEAAS